MYVQNEDLLHCMYVLYVPHVPYPTCIEKVIVKTEKELSRVVALHKTAEKFDPKTEEVFKYLQIFTAVCDAFSHGANDVANAIGPFAAIYAIHQSGGDLSKKAVERDPVVFAK